MFERYVRSIEDEAIAGTGSFTQDREGVVRLGEPRALLSLRLLERLVP